MLDLSHKKLIVWSKSIEFVKLIYQLTNTFPSNEKYGLVSQLRRAAVSIPSNLSEGAARKSYKERKRFFEIARSSLVEVDTQIELCLELNYLSSSDIEEFEKLAIEIFAMLSAIITSR